jgi:hypothetical protein
LPMRTRMQAEKNIYSGDAPLVDEAVAALEAAIPWQYRGPQNDPTILCWRGQQRRRSGRFSSAGGFDKRVRDLWLASGKDHKFSNCNPKGQPLHVCAYSVAM